MANIYDVAKLANVSTATVSKVLSNTPYVSERTRRKVLEAVEELHYVPNLAARGLSRSRTFIIGLVIPYDPDYLFSDPFLLEVMRGVESVTNEHDYNILLSMANRSNQRSAYTRLTRGGYIDGAIMVETFEGTLASVEFQKKGIPFVSIGYGTEATSQNNLHASDFDGAYLAIKHLLDLGHTRIGVISGPPRFMGAMEERMRGVLTALCENGLQLDEKLLGYGDFTVESGYIASREILETEYRPTAIFAMNDRMAMGVMQRAREMELRIPTELSLIGYDDIMLANLTDPPLTTVRQPGVQMGQLAAGKLLELINTGTLIFETASLPVELIVRSSTAPH